MIKGSLVVITVLIMSIIGGNLVDFERERVAVLDSPYSDCSSAS